MKMEISEEVGNQIELKSAQGPIIIERLKPQQHLTHLGQPSYSFTRNCTSLNLQLISVQKMDKVLHSIQRRIYKQKEQRLYAEFIRSNCTRTEFGTQFVQIDAGQVCFERGAEGKFVDSKSAQVHFGRSRKSQSDHEAFLLNENENITVKELVEELKICIVALNASVNHGNNVQCSSGEKPSLHQRQDKKRTALSKNVLSLQNRPKNTNFARRTAAYKPQQFTKVEYKLAKPSIKSESLENRRIASDLKKSPKSVSNNPKLSPMQRQQSQSIEQHKRSENVSDKPVDALALWKMLSEMEKVEEIARKNVQAVNTNVSDNAKTMESNVFAGSFRTNAFSSGNVTSANVHKSEVQFPSQGSLIETADLTSSLPLRRHDLRFRHYNTSFARKFLSPNSDIVAAIKELSNTVVDELLIEVASELLDLPDAFLTELLETEFVNNDFQR